MSAREAIAEADAGFITCPYCMGSGHEDDCPQETLHIAYPDLICGDCGADCPHCGGAGGWPA